jgi:DNA polymerase-3 subunit epsilon
MDTVSEEPSGPIIVQVDLAVFDLPVLTANEQESAAHDEVLKQIDKSSGSKTIWRNQPENRA